MVKRKEMKNLNAFFLVVIKSARGLRDVIDLREGKKRRVNFLSQMRILQYSIYFYLTIDQLLKKLRGWEGGVRCASAQFLMSG